MSTPLQEKEVAQLWQTIEVLEQTSHSQPFDRDSLATLKEAYLKLGHWNDAIRTSKRIADGYIQLGQLSNAILEYESTLDNLPDDPEIRAVFKKVVETWRA